MITPWAAALIIGVLLALAFMHRTGWTPGGLITPGYLVIHLLTDWRGAPWLVLTVGLTWLAAVVARRWLPLHGRRRWGFCVTTGVVLRVVADQIHPRVAGGALGADPLGLIIPGLIANAMLQQGTRATITGLVTVTAATWWALILGGWM